MPKQRRLISLFLLLLLAAALAACGGGDDQQVQDQEPTRTPRPTFTPTPVQPTDTPVPPTAAPAASTAAPAADKPIAVINSETVNARKGPGTDQNIIKEVARGDQFDIVGKNKEGDWWQICCVDGQQAWVFNAYVDTHGAVDSVPVAGAAAAVAAAPAPTQAPPKPTQPPAQPIQAPAQPIQAPAQPTQPPAQPTQAPAQPTQPPPPTNTAGPTATPAPSFPFKLAAQEQFPENNNLVRVFLYVYQGTQALEGYTLRVKKDGAELPVTQKSSAGAGFTWPVADPRQRFQNMKVEFPNVQPGGSWEVQLLDSGGNPAGPPATFTLSGNDTNRELYVRYEKS